jgi:uncharacterized protein YecE (DUF72 family)
MEFGRVTDADISSLDFTIPADHTHTFKTLRSSAARECIVYAGCAKWGRKDWVGTIYPEKTREANFLEHYGQHFNAIELNATFYKLPSRKQTENWAGKVGDHFRFCPKFSDKISHLKRLKEVEPLTERFLEGISGFGKKLGPPFLMLHPQMTPKSIDTVEIFLKSLPADLKIFVEVRHPKWFDSEVFPLLAQLLSTYNHGLVITDASGRRDCVHMALTTDEAFIRFVGNGLHPTDYSRVDDWVQRLAVWMRSGLKTLYFFMHQPEEIHSPVLAKYFVEGINKHSPHPIPVPQFIGQS